MKEVQVNTEELKKSLNDLGPKTQEKMKSIIGESKVRPQNGEPLDLENHISLEYFEDGWGVGDIDILNDQAPYWAAINWGSSHLLGKRVPMGAFSPGEPKPSQDFFRQGRWAEGVAGYTQAHYSFIVQKPIEPMNYIETTVDWLKGQIDELIK